MLYFNLDIEYIKKFSEENKFLSQIVLEINDNNILKEVYYENELIDNVKIFLIKSDRKINTLYRLNSLVDDYFLIEVTYKNNDILYYTTNVNFDKQILLCDKKEKIINCYEIFKNFIKNNFEIYYEKINEKIFHNFIKHCQYSIIQAFIYLKLEINLNCFLK